MPETHQLIALIVALPLAAAIVTALLGPTVLGRAAHWPAVLGVAGAFACSLLLLRELLSLPDLAGFEDTVTLWQWAGISGAMASPAADFTIGVTLRIDALTMIMLAMVTFVSLMVTIFSVGYMQGDRGYWRFFTYIALFVFSMTMLVSVSNFLLLYVFWEAVGVCSYLLIGFWYHKPEAAAAGKKAFLVNRVGDFGFALAVFLIFITYHTLDFHGADGVLSAERMQQGQIVGGGVGLAICLLLLLGACGKSAQLPLHVWLPDAMEGPTPVSALIHAATMVTAGVYLVARCSPLFAAVPEAQLIVAIVGSLTALMGAIIAMTQFDLKRILAYSTVSQLGYMFLGLGVGSLAGVSAGMFHLFTHAFFKALLFLGAGSVMHAMGGVIDIRRFGGLRRLMPITSVVFLCGCLALSGFPLLSGFWSKDAIVAAAHDRADQLAHAPTGAAAGDAHAHHHGDAATYTWISTAQASMVYRALFFIALFTAFLTAIYTFRAFFMTFFGRERIPHEAGHHAHEVPPVMWVPLAVLATAAVCVGGLFQSLGFNQFLANAPSLAFAAFPAAGAHADHTWMLVLSALIALGGIGVAAFLYLGPPDEVMRLAWLFDFRWLRGLADRQWAARLSGLPPVSWTFRAARAVGLEWPVAIVGYLLLLVLTVVCAPLLIGYYFSPYRLSRSKFFCDEIYHALVVAPLRRLAAFSYWLDRFLIDALVDATGKLAMHVGNLLRSMQMGLVPFYALAMILGTLVLLAARFVLAGG